MDSAPKVELNKSEIWKNKLQSLEKVTDLLGTEIEPGVKELVAGFNLLGIPTSSSCGGHTNEGDLGFPYIQGEAVGRPQYRYKGEEEIVKGILAKHSLQRQNEIFGHDKAEDEYYAALDSVMDTNDEIEEYRAWYPKNVNVKDSVEKLVDEFNSSQIQDMGMPLYLSPIYPGYRVEVDARKVNPSNANEIKDCVLKAQEVFRKFSEFIKSKYFNEQKGEA